VFRSRIGLGNHVSSVMKICNVRKHVNNVSCLNDSRLNEGKEKELNKEEAEGMRNVDWGEEEASIQEVSLTTAVMFQVARPM